MGRPQAVASVYDAIAELYDPWSLSVTEDVPFYVAEARKAGGPVVELGREFVAEVFTGLRFVHLGDRPAAEHADRGVECLRAVHLVGALDELECQAQP